MDLILNSALKYSSKLQLLEPIRCQNLYENNHIDKNLLQAVKQLRERYQIRQTFWMGNL